MHLGTKQIPERPFATQSHLIYGTVYVWQLVIDVPGFQHIQVMEDNMVLYRTVFQAKFGKAGELVAAMKESISGATGEQLAALQPRILTDISGSFDTVIIETTHESLAAVEQFRSMMFAQNDETGATSTMAELVESGRNEYYTIEK